MAKEEAIFALSMLLNVEPYGHGDFKSYLFEKPALTGPYGKGHNYKKFTYFEARGRTLFWDLRPVCNLRCLMGFINLIHNDVNFKRLKA